VRVLIVDDDETTCQLLAEVLKRAGIEAVWTADSLTGYQMSLRRHYDLFIFDVRMPSLSGPELAARLKKNDPTARIILISAFADDALRETARSLGVFLLAKPFGPDRLLEAVAQVFGWRA
jgi:DNA-binding response OmpR family regulator